MQNFMLINNHWKPWVWKLKGIKLASYWSSNFFKIFIDSQKESPRAEPGPHHNSAIALKNTFAHYLVTQAWFSYAKSQKTRFVLSRFCFFCSFFSFFCASLPILSKTLLYPKLSFSGFLYSTMPYWN